MNLPRIGIGLPIHNGGRHLRQAIDSLLAQTHSQFELVLLDDGSTDGSAEIAREYARLDRRISFQRNEKRTGLVAAWRRVAQLTSEKQAPDWFAWFSDHDWVDPGWLEQLVALVMADDRIVLAHAHTFHVHGDSAVSLDAQSLETRGMSRYERLRAVSLPAFGAGDVIYGLMRYAVLRECGHFPDAILPDRLIVSEFALYGDIAFQAESLRYRRVFDETDSDAGLIARQLRTLFAESSQPPCPYLSHATYFVRRFLGLDPRCHDAADRMARMYHALIYFQRQYNKYRSECAAELAAAGHDEELAPVLEFISAIADGKWRFLYQDYRELLEKLHRSTQRVAQLKSAYKELKDAYEALRQRGD